MLCMFLLFYRFKFEFKVSTWEKNGIDGKKNWQIMECNPHLHGNQIKFRCYIRMCWAMLWCEWFLVIQRVHGSFFSSHFTFQSDWKILRHRVLQVSPYFILLQHVYYIYFYHCWKEEAKSKKKIAVDVGLFALASLSAPNLAVSAIIDWFRGDKCGTSQHNI